MIFFLFLVRLIPIENILILRIIPRLHLLLDGTTLPCNMRALLRSLLEEEKILQNQFTSKNCQPQKNFQNSKNSAIFLLNLLGLNTQIILKIQYMVSFLK